MSQSRKAHNFTKPSMQITRRYTTAGSDPFVSFTFVKRTSRIANPDGSVVFEMKDLLAPEGWSQVAVDILAQKYFRKAGVPRQSQRVAEEGVPEWLQRSVPVSGDPRDELTIEAGNLAESSHYVQLSQPGEPAVNEEDLKSFLERSPV